MSGDGTPLAEPDTADGGAVAFTAGMRTSWPRLTVIVAAIAIAVDGVLAAALFASGPSPCDASTGTSDSGGAAAVLGVVWFVGAPLAVIAAAVRDGRRGRAHAALAGVVGAVGVCAGHVLVLAGLVNDISWCI